jgi:transcriptional regulator with XRE-family HTH domain
MSSNTTDFEYELRLPEKAGTDGRRVGNGTPYQIQNLWEKHHKIKRLLFIGWTQADIAVEMGMSAVAISYIANSELMKRELNLMRAAADVKALTVREQIDENARKAAVLLHEFMVDEGNEKSLRARIAMDSLSRAGYAPQVNVKGNFTHTHFTLAELEEIKRVALEHNNVIDTQFEEVN